MKKFVFHRPSEDIGAIKVVCVSAADQAEARQIIRDRWVDVDWWINKNPPQDIITSQEDLICGIIGSLDQLEENHVRINTGDPTQKGIWFPQLD